MKEPVVAQPEIPRPVPTPQAPTEPPTRGWWIDPCQPAEGIAQRYYDGTKWTSYVSELFGSTWRDVPVYPPDSPARGWWTDPYRPGLNPQDPRRPAPGPLCQRFHDGERWTPYICYRMSGPPYKKGKLGLTWHEPNFWRGVTEDAAPLGRPAPKLTIGRSIDDYSFPPPVVSGDDPPENPTMGWWKDPFYDDGQRFHDGARWTQYGEFWTRQSGKHLIENPAEPHHRPPAVEYNPGPLRTGRSFAVAMAALFGGIVLLVLSAELDHQGTLSDWLVLIFGAGLVTLRDPVLRALWLR